jgi:tetratricopeptide (TPR) repeat protein
MGEAHRDRGHLEEAVDCFEQALRLRQETGDRSNEALTLIAIGATQLRRASPATTSNETVALAADCFGRAYAIAEELGDRHQAAVALAGSGRAALLAGDLETAQRHARRALTLRTLIPDWYEEASLRRTLGDLALAANDRAAALEQWARAIDLFRRANAPGEAEEVFARREAAFG